VFTNPPTLTDSTTYLVANQASNLNLSWYDCTNDSVVQVGGTRFYPQQTGNYSLIYSTLDSAQTCRDTLPCQSINQIGLPENTESLWQLYPNPVQESLSLSGPLHAIQSIRVLQTNGQEVLRLKVQKELNLANLAAGLYLLEITTPAGVSRIKLLKE
jgi:hypothetical protein